MIAPLEPALPEHLRSRRLESPLGDLLAVASSAGLALLEFHDRRALPTELKRLRSSEPGMADPRRAEQHLDAAATQMDEYFRGARPSFDLPLDLDGTPFERRVWELLLAIPCGRTRSYADLAAELGKLNGQRAVGRANGANRIAIVVPCHRVICSDGTLGGYGGKLWRKEWLLEHEAKMSGRAARAKQGELEFA